MNVAQVVQHSPQWFALRATCYTASEAPAAAGVSKHMARAELLRQKSTGIAPDVSEFTQALFDKGHAAEAAARPLAEEITGDLYPVTTTLEVDGLPLLASLDGATMMEDVIWECKLWNEALAVDVRAGTLAPHYTVQMDQQLLVSGAEKCLFMTSDGTPERTAWCWYETTPEKTAAVVAMWKQFRADLDAYAPPAAAAVVVAAAVTALPAVSVQVSGAITVQNNFKLFETALRDFIDSKLIREPSTDQDFADLSLQIKALQNAEAALDAAETQMLSQVESVDAAKRTKDMLLKLARDNRLMAEKLLAARKEQIKGEIVAGAIATFAKHIADLNQPYMPRIAADFAGVIKGKRTVASLQDAVDTELARVKIEAAGAFQRITANVQALDAHAEHRFLFPDVATLVLKAPDDLAAMIASRIAAHKAKEAARIEAETARIRAEEQARAQREALAAEAKRTEQRLIAERSEREKAAAREAEAARAVRQAEADAQAKTRPAETVILVEQGPLSTPDGKLRPDVAEVFRQADFAAFDAVLKEHKREVANLRLGTICERLAPIAVTAQGLADLGIPHRATDKAAKLYRESDFLLICAALLGHVQRAAAMAAEEVMA